MSVASPHAVSGESSPPSRRLFSIVLPAYNEAAVLPDLYAQLKALKDPVAALGLDCEFVFVNDGSRDGTAEILDGLVKSDPQVKVVHLTRNFGHQAAVAAGLSLARGDAVAVMDCDLQDPPEVLLKMLEQWRQGFQVVFAVRRRRKEWFGKRLAYWVFYRLLGAIGEIKIPLDSGDFSLLDRRAVDLLNSLPEQQRFVRGLRTWIGLKQIGIEYERAARQAGESHYSFHSLIKLALDGIISFSTIPLRMATLLGLASAVIAVALGAWVIAAWLMDPRTPRGWATLACLLLFLSGVNLLAIGIIGEYISKIFLEVKRRPTFLIARVAERGSDASGERRDLPESPRPPS